MRIITAFLLACLLTRPCLAWTEGGHHLIAVLAYELLTGDEQQHLQTVLRTHPRFAEDFIPPQNVTEPDEVELFRIGRASYWPDIARAQPEFDRPTWHWQLGSSLTIGKVVPPKNPGPLPDEATLESKDLHIAQAVELCRRIWKDKARSSSDHALAICWLAHLIGDAHQPCHAGSLYTDSVFPAGDRGANLIMTKQANTLQPKNLHFLWDQLLGLNFDAEDVRRRAISIKLDSSIWNQATEAARGVEGKDPLTWLTESSEYGRSHVYSREVLSAIETAEHGATNGTSTIGMVDLSEEYLKAASDLARVRAAFAAHRLASILREGTAR